jgi:hypothetical protein
MRAKMGEGAPASADAATVAAAPPSRAPSDALLSDAMATLLLPPYWKVVPAHAPRNRLVRNSAGGSLNYFTLSASASPRAEIQQSAAAVSGSSSTP